MGTGDSSNSACECRRRSAPMSVPNEQVEMLAHS
jgi:hypothetical protein